MRSSERLTHPTLARGYLACGYAPMIELLGYLAANGFSNYIASGGGRDFMRPISQEMYGIPRERVIGSTAELDIHGRRPGGTITHKAAPDYLDDGPEADPDLESDRPSAAARRRQLERRHPDAPVRPARSTARSIGC